MFGSDYLIEVDLEGIAHESHRSPVPIDKNALHFQVGILVIKTRSGSTAEKFIPAEKIVNNMVILSLCWEEAVRRCLRRGRSKRVLLPPHV